MIITISGKAGSGKSTIAKHISEKLKLRHYSIGDLMRVMASDKGITLIELNKLAEIDKSIDFELDAKLKELGKTKDDFVVDGRLTAHFIPDAKARVFLDTEDKVRAKRILNDKRDSELSDGLKEMMAAIKKREESEKIRYQQYYGVDYMDMKLYNLVIDTTNLTPDEVTEKIVDFVKRS
jgi:CMP/dCMP kinase